MMISSLSRPFVRSSLYVSALAVATVGCAADDLPETKLGNTSDLLVTMEPVTPVPERLPIVTEEDGIDPFVIGDWVGHAEDLFAPSNADGSRPSYVFPSGSSEIYLHLDALLAADSGSFVRFGQPEAPVPQPGVAYGEGIDYFIAESIRRAGSPEFPPVEGVAYSLGQQAFLIEGDYPALGFVYQVEDGFADWCPLQTPLPTGTGDFNCAGAQSWGSSDSETGCSATLADGSEQAIDCNFVTLCASLACDCDETSCQTQARGARRDPPSELWIAREGDQLLGYLSRAVFEHGLLRPMPIGTIRFERVEP